MGRRRLRSGGKGSFANLEIAVEYRHGLLPPIKYQPNDGKTGGLLGDDPSMHGGP